MSFSVEVTYAIIRMTGGNFRLLNRVVTQIQRVMRVNDAAGVLLALVEAAREILVVGQA